MAEAPRRQARDGSQPANDDRAPRTRSRATDIRKRTATSDREPTLYKGYVLRHKTPEEWEEFGRLNPDIDPAFWDSPIVNKREDRKTKRAIKKRGATRRASRANTSKMPYDVTPEDSRAFRKAVAKKRLLDRKSQAIAKKEEKAAKRERRRLVSAVGAGVAANSYGGKVIGPKRTAVMQNPAVAIWNHFMVYLALILVATWFPLQVSLSVLGLTMMGLSGMAIWGTGPILSFITYIGGEAILEGISLIFTAFLGGGFAIYVALVIAPSVFMLFTIYLLLRSMSPLSGSGKFWKLASFALAVLGCCLPLFVLVGVWVAAVKSNPG